MPELEGDDWWRRPPVSSDDEDGESDDREPDDEDDSIALCPFCKEEIADEEIVRCPYCNEYLSKESYRPARYARWVTWTAMACFCVIVLSYLLFLR